MSLLGYPTGMIDRLRDPRPHRDRMRIAASGLGRRSGPGVQLDGAVVVITGASSGIGRAAARRFAGRHGRLFLVARSAEALEDVVVECRVAGAASVMLGVVLFALTLLQLFFARKGEKPT